MKNVIGKGREQNELILQNLNRHGLIAGATGTGKTVTLKVLTEILSEEGIPTIIQDVKGDLSNLSKAGTSNKKIEERLEEIGVSDFSFKSFPVNIFDPESEIGIPLRMTISEMGPILLSKILELNDTQKEILNITFKIADENGLLLLDIKDLRSMLNFVDEKKSELKDRFGNITTASISAIIRKLSYLEEIGGSEIFSEPAIEIKDFLKKENGLGVVNIINAKKLVENKELYSSVLLYLLSEIYDSFEEVGDLDKPKLVFFFDEAHLIFDGIDKNLMDKITQMVRLVRSKGISIFFITQNPMDIPEVILAQLGNKFIHGLRAYTQKEIQNIKAIAKSFRTDDVKTLEEDLLNLRTGEAIVSLIDESGVPQVADKTYMMPPKSSFVALSEQEVENLYKNSELYRKYSVSIDRESAYEMLMKKAEEDRDFKEREDEISAREKELEKIRREREREKENRSTRREKSLIDKSVDSMLGSLTRSIGRELARGIMGSLKKKFR